jgi:Arc/MetJ family transcription regulator
MPKRRVNITIDEDVHAQTTERLKMVGIDFSSILEQACLSFLASTNDLFRRFKQVDTLGDVSPGEIRVLMLQALGHMNMQVGSQSASVMKELDVIEARQAVSKTTPAEPIHTITPKKSRTKVLKN